MSWSHPAFEAHGWFAVNVFARHQAHRHEHEHGDAQQNAD